MSGVIMLGAGLSGLGCAGVLPEVRIYEKTDHPGGHAWSHCRHGICFDEGAHIAHSRDPEWRNHLISSGVDIHRVPQSRVINYWHGHWITYPVQNHLHELPIEERKRALVDFVRAQVEHRDRSPADYREWCLAHYGTFLTDRFYREYTGKYWRVPMEELATDWLKGRLLPAEMERILAGALAPQEERQSVFSEFWYPATGGYYAFFKNWFDRRPVIFNCPAVRVDWRRREVTFAGGAKERYDALASSIPLPELVHLLVDPPSEVQRAAGLLRHLQLLCVNFVIRRPGLTPAHWFYVYDPDMDVARVTVISNLAPGSVPPGRTVLQAEIFRRQDEPMEADRLGKKAVQDLAHVLGFDPQQDVERVDLVHVPYAYVISDHRRASAVDTIRSWMESEGIFPMGLFGRWQFIWSDEAFRSGEDAGRRIREWLTACRR